jgi:hypothetical protein
LLYLFHVNTQHYHELRDVLTIGRVAGDIICPNDGQMSSKHARVWVEAVDFQKVIYLEDLGSKNRTMLDRTEIPPLQKMVLDFNMVLEIGEQQFLATDSSDLNLQEVHELIEKIQKRTPIKLENEKAKSSDGLAPPPFPKENPLEAINNKEQLLKDIQKSIIELEQETKRELLELEQTKQKLIIEAKTKKENLLKESQLLKDEVEAMKTELERVRLEVEMKKKKIINLKDIPSE